MRGTGRGSYMWTGAVILCDSVEPIEGLADFRRARRVLERDKTSPVRPFSAGASLTERKYGHSAMSRKASEGESVHGH
jgi:hypothetical protein